MEAPDIVRETHLDFLQAGALGDYDQQLCRLVPFHIGQDRFDAQAAEWARQAGPFWRVKRWEAKRDYCKSGRKPATVIRFLPP